MGGFLTATLAALEREQDRWFLWAPVMLGCGIALYFALTFEPPPLVAGAAVAAAMLLYWRWREGSMAALVGGVILSTVLGFALAQFRTISVAAPLVTGERVSHKVSGWIELAEPREQRGQRLTIRVHKIDDLASEMLPHRIRVRTLKENATLQAGDAVTLRATLSPPAGPSLPGGYDFARQAWFLGLGGVGYTLSDPQPTTIEATPPWDLRARAAFNRLRQDISRRVTAALPNETGAIAVALITGERGGITTATNSAYRDSGLIHILSISGLHMAIMAGAMFFTARFVLSLIPALALRFDIRKWAAVAGALGAFGYLLISGASPPAVRSFLMVAIMFAAILLDRPALALRNVALASLVMLVLTPESLIDVGFQMSFAAVVALIAGYEAWRDWRASRGHAPMAQGLWRTPLLFASGIIASTLLASLSVAPFGIYHFHQSQQYAMLANLMAVPAVNLVIMPAALATLLALPLGLEAIPLYVMGLGIDFMTIVARWVAALPGSVIRVAAIPAAAFGLMVCGGAWLLLWRGRLRLWGLAAIVAGLAMTPFEPRPDVLVSRSGSLVAVRGADGRLAALAGRADQFDLGRWLERDGDGRSAAAVSAVDAIAKVFRCDSSGCVTTPGGRLLSVPRHPSALRDDCERAQILVLKIAQPGGCTQPAQIIDASALRRQGAHTLRFNGPDTIVRTVAGTHGRRPWTRDEETAPPPRVRPPMPRPRSPTSPDGIATSPLIEVSAPDGEPIAFDD
jgi:competence protein ComEC